MARSLHTNLFSTAIIAAGWASAAAAQDMVGSAEQQGTAVKVELIGNSRLGCGERTPLWAFSNGGSQCAFDTATRGMRLSALQDFTRGSVEAYATVAHTASGAFTPDQLLVAPQYRTNEATKFFMAGVKGSILDDRLKLTAEFARTDRVVDLLQRQDWALADSMSRSGSSALVRLDATLANRPGLKWTLTGEYRSATDDYSIGRSFNLARYFAMPGTRLSLSSKARVGQVGLRAGLEQVRNPFGTLAVHKAGLDLQGLTVNVRSRESSAAPIEGSTLIDSRSHTKSLSLDVDSVVLAAWVLPNVDELPWLVPTTVSISATSGETESRYQTSTERYSRSSLALDGTWETPIGETSLSYWRDTRNWLTGDARSRSSQTIQVDHSVSLGNWRFGVDAALTRSREDGSTGYDERSFSFGQSVGYSVRNGPEFRLQLGQDREVMQMSDDYASSDRYSSISASLDLSRYLQNRFERPDLRLTLDYRKAVERSDDELSLYDELIDRWSDRYRREGFLMSFGMKL